MNLDGRWKYLFDLRPSSLAIVPWSVMTQVTKLCRQRYICCARVDLNDDFCALATTVPRGQMFMWPDKNVKVTFGFVLFSLGELYEVISSNNITEDLPTRKRYSCYS